MPRWIVVIALGGCLAATGCSSSPSIAAGEPGPIGSPGHTVAAKRGNLDAATLKVTSGATAVTVAMRDLHGQLLSAATPLDSSQRPAISEPTTGTAAVSLVAATPGNGPADLNVMLDSSVRWTIQLDGGATDETLDLRGGVVPQVSLGAGVTRAAITYGAISGTSRLVETGGASDLTVSIPAATPVSTLAAGGAGTVKIGAATHTGVAGGTAFVDPGYASAQNRLRVELTGGVSRLQIRRR